MTEKAVEIGGHYEPTLTMQFLPGCRNCGSKHPLAFNPPLPHGLCPGCGNPAGEPGEPRTETAEIVNPGVVARILGKLGL